MLSCPGYDLNMLGEEVFQGDYWFGVVKKDPRWSKQIITDVCKHCVLEACRERAVRPALPLEQINAVSVICLLTHQTNRASKERALDEEIGEEG